MRQSLQSDRRHERGQRDVRPEHGRPGRHGPHFGAHARAQPPAREGGKIFAQRPLVLGAAGEVAEARRLERPLGEALVVDDAQRFHEQRLSLAPWSRHGTGRSTRR
jgi:hypothetical protein